MTNLSTRVRGQLVSTYLCERIGLTPFGSEPHDSDAPREQGA
jgi:hypothetical protein